MANQINKLAFVDSKLGAPTSGQQTTRVLYHTIVNPGISTSLRFFNQFQGLTPGQTNLTQNKLDSSESMVIKSIWLAKCFDNVPEFGGGILFPFSSGNVDVEQQTLSVIIGNQTVVKDLPLQFNAGNTGQSFDRLHANAGVNAYNSFDIPSGAWQGVQPVEIRLLTDIVLPPQTSFEVRIDSDGIDYGQGANYSVHCALAGYGKIFSAGSSF